MGGREGGRDSVRDGGCEGGGYARRREYDGKGGRICEDWV